MKTGAYGKWLLDFLLHFTALYFPLLLFVERSTAVNALAKLQGHFLNSLGLAAASASSYVFLDGSAFKIVAECSGIVLIALIAALLFTTMRCKEALSALIPSSLALFAYNFFRISATLVGTKNFASLHELLWLLDGVAVLAVWCFFALRKKNSAKFFWSPVV